jgi:hypothetical protein
LLASAIIASVVNLASPLFHQPIFHIAIVAYMLYYSYCFLKRAVAALRAAVDLQRRPVSLLLTLCKERELLRFYKNYWREP